MAKKIVRGITDIKTITKQGFDTNNVNDLLSDSEHNYIHRKKKDGTDEYHCLTDNVKTVESSDTSLLKVTNYNKTTNKVTLAPQHDETKQDRLTPGYGIKIDEHNTINSNIPTSVEVGYELNNFGEGLIKGAGLNNAPDNSCWVVTAYSEDNLTIQEALKFVTTGKHVEKRVRYKQSTTWTEWVDTVPDVTSKVVLTSPNGTKYNLSVTDDGVFTVTPEA